MNLSKHIRRLNQFSSLPSDRFPCLTRQYRGGSAQFELLQGVDMNEANYYLYGYWPSLRSIQNAMLQYVQTTCVHIVITIHQHL